MQAIYETIQRVGKSNIPFLMTGETGVSKEHIARYIRVSDILFFIFRENTLSEVFVMYTQVKNNFLFYTFTLLICLNSVFLMNTAAQVDADATYTFESIEVPGVDFLELTASSDFEDYAGNTKSEDGTKTVGFTLIDGVFTTYDFPGSQNTYFYALGNNGQAAGHYQDSNGIYHGVILENGELRQYDFPGAVETFIYGISDATGALTGVFTDASGVHRGFSGDAIIEYPGATATFADFVNSNGGMVGSYVITSVNRHRISCYRTIRTHLIQRHGFRTNSRKTVLYPYPFMIHLGG